MADNGTDRARMTRRAALKAGAAAGVGAAALAGPQIGVLGSSPAYGQAGVCSKPVATLTQTLGSLNNGAGQCGQFARINNSYRPGNFTGNGINATWNSEGCLGSSNLTVTAAEQYCIVSVTVTGNGGPITTSIGPFTTAGSATVAFPTILDGQVPNGEGTLTISCSDDIDCAVV